MAVNNNLWEKFKEENLNNLNSAASRAKEVLGQDAPNFQSLLNNENLSALFSNLSPADMEKLSLILKNPELINKILASPKARENLKKILGK